MFETLNMPLAFLGGVGSSEMVLMGIVALMLFGSKLPEVARKFGGTYRGLKKSVDEFKREFESVETYEPPTRTITSESSTTEESSQSTAPKFTPPT
jgi:sec-independent protein translocase protein TatA